MSRLEKMEARLDRVKAQILELRMITLPSIAERVLTEHLEMEHDFLLECIEEEKR